MILLLTCALVGRAAAGLSVAPRVAGLSVAPTPVTYFVDTQGSDSNAGTSKLAAFASCNGALSAIAATIQADPAHLPVGGWDVVVSSVHGRYTYNASTACCFTASCHNVTFSGTAASPIVIRGDGKGLPVFDGSLKLDASALALVTNKTVLTIINPAARGKVKVMPLPGGTPGVLQWGAVPLTPSVWPNKGLGYVRRVYDEGNSRIQLKLCRCSLSLSLSLCALFLSSHSRSLSTLVLCFKPAIWLYYPALSCQLIPCVPPLVVQRSVLIAVRCRVRSRQNERSTTAMQHEPSMWRQHISGRAANWRLGSRACCWPGVWRSLFHWVRCWVGSKPLVTSRTTSG